MKNQPKPCWRAWRAIVLFASICLLGCAVYGCGAKSLDPQAEEIVVTNLSQLEGISFDGFDRLTLLDLRAVEADATLIDDLRLRLPGREIRWNVPLGSKTFDSRAVEVVLPRDCTANDLANLAYFTALERVDARACEIDEAFAKAAYAYEVEFVWNATIGGVYANSDATTLDLSLSPISAESVMYRLNGLGDLKEVVCNDTPWSAAELAALRAAYPDVSFVRDVDVFGTRVPADTSTLDFSDKAVDLDALSQILLELPALKTVNLEGQIVTLEEMERLTNAFPAVSFSFVFDSFGQRLTSDMTELDLNGYPLSSPEEMIRVLRFLPNMQNCDLSGCGLTNEQVEQLMAQFPAVKFVWVIRLGAWEIRTDITAFSKGNRTKFPNGMGYFTGVGKTNFYDEDIQVLKYCKDLVYLDLGHGNRITDLSVLTQLKHLRVLIVSMNKLVDLTPIAELSELELLEIYQNPFTDITPVTKLSKLKYLNCNSTLMTDASPLFTMQNLEMLWFVSVRNVSAEQRKELVEALPNCRVNFHPNSRGPEGWKGNPLYIEYQTAFGLPIDN